MVPPPRRVVVPAEIGARSIPPSVVTPGPAASPAVVISPDIVLLAAPLVPPVVPSASLPKSKADKTVRLSRLEAEVISHGLSVGMFDAVDLGKRMAL